MKQQQSFPHLLLLALLGVYYLCGIAIAIPILEGDYHDELSFSSGDIFAATTKGEEGEDTVRSIVPPPRGGGRDGQGEGGQDLYSVMVVGRRDNNDWRGGKGGLDGNYGNKNEGFLALNSNNSPVMEVDASGTVVGKNGDGQSLDLASFSLSSSSSSSLFGVGDTSVSSEIDPTVLGSKEEIASNPVTTKSCASLAAWEARLNARERQQDLREENQNRMGRELGEIRDTLTKQAQDLKNLLEKKIAEEDALPMGCTCRIFTPEFPSGAT